MDAGHDEGQVTTALGVLAEACERLASGSHLDTLPLMSAYRHARPAGHPLAAADSPDLAFLGTLYALGGAPLLAAPRLVVVQSAPRMPPEVLPLSGGVEVRVPPSEEAPGDVLALALGLTVEAAKLRRALGDGHAPGPALAERVLALPVGSLAQAFGDDDSAADALAALLRSPASRRVHALAPPAAPALLDIDVDGPLFVVAGATERLHDLISPWARRLLPRLQALVGSDDGDAPYAALPALLQIDPSVHDERLAAEQRDGLMASGDALLIDHAALDPALADPRGRDALATLRRNSARTIVVGRRRAALEHVLETYGAQLRVVVVLAEALTVPGTLLMPDVLVHPGGPHYVDLRNALGLAAASGGAHVSLHVPSLGLAPRSAPGLLPGSSLNALLWPLVSVAARARAFGHLARATQLAVGLTSPASADSSALALHCLAKMAAAPREGPSRRAA
jgi:hypothetical protein